MAASLKSMQNSFQYHFDLPKPTTEEERFLIRIIKDINNINLNYQHSASNLLGLISRKIKNIDNKHDENTNNDNEINN